MTFVNMLFKQMVFRGIKFVVNKYLLINLLLII